VLKTMNDNNVTNDLTIDRIGNNFTGGNSTRGYLHDVRIYSDLKDQAFITQLYNSGE